MRKIRIFLWLWGVFFFFSFGSIYAVALCDTRPGLADSYVFALSWQPGFCEAYGYRIGKSECYHLSPDSYEANHLVLHGLWPTQAACGISYGYCGVKKRRKHCSYPPVMLSEVVSTQLKKFMPSYASGSCLERHEWNRHGRCQARSSDDYFALAIQLNKQFNSSSFAIFLRAHKGQIVQLSELQQAIVQDFGLAGKNKIVFNCSHGQLVDVYIMLPAKLSMEETISSLLHSAPDAARHNGCPAFVRISDFSSS